ncbi:StAR-related lipid transfer protein 7 mitochondrial, partial [Taenia solium]
VFPRTVETFDVAKYNEISKYIQKPRQKEGENSSQEASQQPIGRVYSSLESPLTFYVRDLRQILRERQQEFFRKLFDPQKDESVSSSDGLETPITPASSPRGVMLMDLSSRLSTDGAGFVDSEWECMIDRPDLRMWRRPSSKTSNGSGKAAVGLYEYRVCGSFTDISARCFLEVQLNLAYRRHWDKSVVVLESKKSANASGSEVIRWVARFPFPLARREYIYARRWWLTTAGVGDQSFALIISRVGNAQPTDSTGSIATVPQNNGGGNGEETQSGGGLVSVRSYKSNMLIRSHGSIDEPGLDYFLIYFDDPQLVLSTGAASRLSLAVIPRLLDNLHNAALTISTKGLPDTIPPVVLRSSQPLQSGDGTSVTSTSEPTPVSAENTTTPITARVYRFFFHS